MRQAEIGSRFLILAIFFLSAASCSPTFISESYTSFSPNPHILLSSETNPAHAILNATSSLPENAENAENTEIIQNEYSYKNQQSLDTAQLIMTDRSYQIDKAVSNFILWINKTADKSIYAEEENVTYTIKYKNNGVSAAKYVTIIDALPDVEVVSMSPSADYVAENNLTWDIGTLVPGQSGSITLEVKQPKTFNSNFDDDSGVSGNGFVNIWKSLSTHEEINTLCNTATISGIYEDKRYPSVSSSVTVELGARSVANIKNKEHGSGYYRESQSSKINNTIPSIRLKKDLSARYEPVALSLPENKVQRISSKWSDCTSASTNENGSLNSVVDENRYMDLINRDTSYDTRNSEITYSSQGNFSGGIAHIGYTKRAAGSKKDTTYISETYHGSFQTKQSLDSFKTSPTYKKEASGTGFVSSEKIASCSLRSNELGSGSYQSAESIQGGSIKKIITLVHMPNNQLAGASKIRYDSKWSEAMYALDTEKDTEILNRISSADYVQKDALMSSSFFSMTGGFNGTNNLNARALEDAMNSTGESFRLDQVLIGSLRLDTTIGLGQSLKYVYPHINLTKRVFHQDDDIFTYRIWINNDGNETLGPVVVVDQIPVEATFISSTLRPIVQGRIVSWTLQALPPGETTIIDLKISLESISPAVINRVQAVARYQNRTILAEAASSPYDTIDGMTTNESIKLEDATTYGDWKPPSCFYLNSSMTGCGTEIDDYYNNLSDNCSDIP